MYNTNLVDETQAAKLSSYDSLWTEDVSDRGIAVLDGVTASNGQLYYYFLDKQFGEQAWTALAAKNPFVGASTPAADAVSRGEVGVGLASESIAQQMYDSGAPVRWVVPNPSLVDAWPVAISQTAPHGNAAKLLYEFILSKTGQTIFAQTGLPSARDDIAAEPDVASQPWFTKYADRSRYALDQADFEKAVSTIGERFKQVFAK